VSRFLTVAGLALRELWISFRLLVVVGALLLAALPTALLAPAVPFEMAGTSWTPLQLFAIGLSAALALVAGLAAATLASERQRGTIGWLVNRAVPRPIVLLGWFSAFALVNALAIAPSAALAWLTQGEASQGIGGPAAFVAPVVAAWAAGVAAVTLGLLLGSLLPGLPAAMITILVVAGLLVPAASGVLPALAVLPAPGAGLAVLGGLHEAARPIGDSLRAAGASLTLAAAALVLGSAALGRADL
jgi:hypothetical protein